MAAAETPVHSPSSPFPTPLTAPIAPILLRTPDGLVYHAGEPLPYSVPKGLARDHEPGLPVGHGTVIGDLAAIEPGRVSHPFCEGEGHVDEIALGEIVQDRAYSRRYATGDSTACRYTATAGASASIAMRHSVLRSSYRSTSCRGYLTWAHGHRIRDRTL